MSDFVKNAKKLIKMVPKDFPGSKEFDEGREYWKARKKLDREIDKRLTKLREQKIEIESLLYLIDEEGF